MSDKKDKKLLKQLSKDDLIRLLLEQKQHISKINVRLKTLKFNNKLDKNQPNVSIKKVRKPVPTPRKTVKQLVEQYENDIILPPPEFRDDFKQIKKQFLLQELKKLIEKPIPEKRTIITKVEEALKKYTASFEVEIPDQKDPLIQLQLTRNAKIHLFKNLLTQYTNFKYNEVLKVLFVKYSNNKKINKVAYFNSKSDFIQVKMIFHYL